MRRNVFVVGGSSVRSLISLVLAQAADCAPSFESRAPKLAQQGTCSATACVQPRKKQSASPSGSSPTLIFILLSAFVLY